MRPNITVVQTDTPPKKEHPTNPPQMEQNTPTIESVVQHDLSSLVIQAELPANTNIAPTDYRALHQAKIDALPAIVDNKTAQANQAMLTRLVTARTSIDKYRLNMTEPLRAQLAAVNAYLGVKGEGGLQEKLKAIEGPLVQRKEAWEDEQEKKRQEELAARENRARHRAGILLENSMKFDGTVYHLEELIIHYTDVWNNDEDVWEKWCKEKLVHKAAAYQEKQQRLQNRLQRLLDLGMERARRGDGQNVLRLQGLAPDLLEAEKKWEDALALCFRVHGPEFEKNPELLAFVNAVKEFAQLAGALKPNTHEHADQ